MKLLIVDDNADINEMLAKYFSIKGHQCKTISDGMRGLEEIMTNHYDAILLDLAMPVFSGGDIIKTLYVEGKAKTKNIVVFTASSISDSDKQLLLKNGVAMILKKPMDPDELLTKLQSIA